VSQPILGDLNFVLQSFVGPIQLVNLLLIGQRHLLPITMSLKDNYRDHQKRDAHHENENRKNLPDKIHESRPLPQSGQCFPSTIIASLDSWSIVRRSGL
jgi:hypothetical protein